MTGQRALGGSLRVAGIDLSLTSTGIATHDGALHTITSKQRGIDRCIDITNHLIQILDPYASACIVAIEGYSYSSKNSHAHALGELGGITRLRLRRITVPWIDIPPATVKKYATGRGNAPKDQVLVAAVQRLDITPRNSDEADAAWLRALTLDAYGQPLCTVPKTHRAALDAIDWPTIGDPEEDT